MKRALSGTSLAALLALPLATSLAAPVVAQAQSAPAISVNGETVRFDQPPVERAGRIYVPLRGVFERLGAMVVFQDGRINATRGATTIALGVGDPTATVNGQPQQLDSPPFSIGARTMVPLRFVAQALGATVSYDDGANSVSIVQQLPNEVITPVPRPPVRPPIPPIPMPAPAIVPLPAQNPQPPNGAAVDGPRPAIGAAFPLPIQPDSVQVRLDGRDVTAAAYVSAQAVRYNPPFDLPYGPHRVQVTGRLKDARRFASTWGFTNHIAGPARNYLRALQPPNGTRVGRTFTVRGTTAPGSLVEFVATATLRLPNGAGETYTQSASTRANGAGQFGQALTVGDRATNAVVVRITSRAPNGPTATATIQLRSF